MTGTEHQSIDGGPHPDEWRAGATCGDCDAHLEETRIAKFNKNPGFNLAWLRNSNETGQTATEMVKEIESEAKRTGRDIRHVGGSSKAKKERNDRLRAEKEASE